MRRERRDPLKSQDYVLAVVRKNDIWQLSSCSLERIFMVKVTQYRR